MAFFSKSCSTIPNGAIEIKNLFSLWSAKVIRTPSKPIISTPEIVDLSGFEVLTFIVPKILDDIATQELLNQDTPCHSGSR